MKKIKYFSKVMISGFFAFVILNMLCFIYHNKPLSVNVVNGATSVKYVGNTRFSLMHEGWGRGFVNDDGYNNIVDLKDVKSIDALLMGSSQMEGFHLAQNQTAVSVLNGLAEEDFFTYNVGIAGHDFYYCVSDLDNALATYRPKQYAIIELPTVEIGGVTLEKTLNDLPRTYAQSKGLIGLLKSIPYVRLLATQYDSLQHKKIAAEPEKGGVILEKDTSADRVNLINCNNTKEILNYIASVCDEYDVTPIVFLYQTVKVDAEGNGYVDNTLEQIGEFKALCEEQGIVFVDTSYDMLRLYKEDYRLCTGFFDTMIGTGHLNKYGHEIIAQNLYKTIKELQEEDAF